MELQHWIKGPAENSIIQFFRYIFVGGSAFVMDFLLLYILWNKFHVYYLFAAGFAFVGGILYNYLLSTVWVFNKRSLDNKWLEFFVFTVIGVVGLGLTELFMFIFTDLWHVYVMVSKAFAASLVFLWNFFARKILLFGNSKLNNKG
ncbi:MAG TPA: GtrA family protein [Bacillota bacterium]|nr:GtrA family protein [Bacillota bacterium]